MHTYLEEMQDMNLCRHSGLTDLIVVARSEVNGQSPNTFRFR